LTVTDPEMGTAAEPDLQERRTAAATPRSCLDEVLAVPGFGRLAEAAHQRP
jgi:hypothetical protein